MQLSSRQKNYILDTIELRSHLHVLNKVFTNPKIVKILHGSKSDIVWLQKDLGIYVVNLFDTGVAAKVLGLKGSLGFLLEHYCQVTTDKKFQIADWRQRPLPKEMSEYARMDTHYLHYIYDKMRLQLVQPKYKEDSPINFLRSVFKTSKEISLLMYEKPVPKDSAYFGIMQRNNTLMGEGQLQVLQLLLLWRDYIARIEDESIKYVMQNDVLFDLAKSSPRNFTELESVLRRHPKHTKHVSIIKHEEDLLERINKTIKECEAKIERRLSGAKRNASSFNPFDDSSDEEKNIKKKSVSAKKVDLKKLQVKTNDLEIKKQVKIGVKKFTKSNSSNKLVADKGKRTKEHEKIEKFNREINMLDLMGFRKSQMPNIEKSQKISEDPSNPTNPPAPNPEHAVKRIKTNESTEVAKPKKNLFSRIKEIRRLSRSKRENSIPKQ